MTMAAALTVALLAPQAGSAAEAPRFPGAATTVAVNRADGRLAVLTGSQLQILENATATTPVTTFEVPGKDPRVLEYCGPNLRYVTHDVQGMPEVFVAISVVGRERLAWPNPGLSDLFPTDTSRLTLDGRGVYGFLTLVPAARVFFSLPEDIPLGAGVAATFRFAGEKLLARASELFAGFVALSPDDMVLARRGGGLMRSRAPDGVVWKREASGGDWRIVDVDLATGTVAAVDAQGAVVGTDLEKGEPRWRCELAGSHVRDARLVRGGRLLMLATDPGRSLALADPATGKRSGPGIVELCERQGLAKQLAEWLAKAASLDGLLEVTTSTGTAWLLRGSDGWYLVPR
jgi:hypothetical protein